MPEVFDMGPIVHIKINEIFADSDFNCRGYIAPIDVVELSRNIDTHGLQQPIVVRPIKNDKFGYKIISGHRRHKAFAVLGRETIPAIVNSNISDKDALVMNLGENLHRKDLNIMQEAHALERLKLAGLSESEVAKEIGKSQTWVHIRYLLLELPNEIREAAAAGYVTQSQIKSIHALGTRDEQLEAAAKAKKAKISGTKAPVLSKKVKRNIFKAKARPKDDIFFMQEHIAEAIGNNFGTRCLAWAAGEITDIELFQDIEGIADRAQIKYTIPYHLGK